MKTNCCYNCKNYHSHKEIESWEMSHIYWYVFICDVRPTVTNLKQFPFKNTKCEKFEQKVLNNDAGTIS